MKRELSSNLSGNEVYYTAYSLLVILEIRVVNFIAKRVSIFFSYKILLRHARVVTTLVTMGPRFILRLTSWVRSTNPLT